MSGQQSRSAFNSLKDDDLADFQQRTCWLEGGSKQVYVAGSGPAVIVMAELPGISPQVVRFARWVRDAGFTVYLPSLFGRDGAVMSAEEGAAVFQRICISAEFRTLAGQGSSPVTNWLRALARQAHQECGGPGVGAIGMCLTGNFALNLMLEPAVIAPVVCQPSLPLDNPAAIAMSAEELQAVGQRLQADDLTVMAYRFRSDPFCRAERFSAYAAALGDRFIARIIPDDVANTETSPFFARYIPHPHSVVTQHLVDVKGHPTLAARDEILDFLSSRLRKPEF